MRPGEVVEVLEGPRKEDPLEVLRVRGVATKDGATGWVTQKDASGKDFLEVKKQWVCVSTVAITTSFDIGDGKAIRKLDVNENLVLMEEFKEDPKRMMTRVKVKTTAGEEGWVTVKGNQGTAFIEETEKFHTCVKSTPIEVRFNRGSKTVRMLEEGEVFEVYEGPRAETKDGSSRVKGRSLNDGSEGWFTLAAGKVTPWAPRYRCDTSTPLTDGLDSEGSKTVRNIDQGEFLEALDAPVEEKATGLVRVRVRAEKDGSSGFATVRGAPGPACLTSVLFR